MKVKITCKNDNYRWYGKHIGETFEIEEIKKSSIYDKNLYLILNGNGKGIYEDDCDLVPEKEEFPTIKEDYF